MAFQNNLYVYITGLKTIIVENIRQMRVNIARQLCLFKQKFFKNRWHDFIIKKTNIMKKKNTITDKKQFAMRNNKSTDKKSKKYIYTEADLGEGLLDAGVTYPYDSREVILNRQEGTNNLFDIAAKNNNLYNAESPIVQNDFSYSYYL